MARWQDAFPKGTPVEVLFSFADGNKWVAGHVERKLPTSGYPVVVAVAARGVVSLVVDRKKDIRLPPPCQSCFERPCEPMTRSCKPCRVSAEMAADEAPHG